jgi:hypothetical protein
MTLASGPTAPKDNIARPKSGDRLPRFPGLEPQQPKRGAMAPVIISRRKLERRIDSVFTTSRIIVSAAIVLAAASTALAKDGGLPNLDIEQGCRASEKAMASATGTDADTFASCKNDENDARKQLERNWTTYPASDKARCIQPKEYTPSFVEWLTCIEMERDVKAMRQGEPPISNTVDKCPAVRYRQDGTIISVNAC